LQSFIKKLDSVSNRLATRNYLLAGLLATVFCMLGFQWLKTQLGALMLDEMMGYDRDTLDGQLLLYGAAGRHLHLIFTLSLDMVFPLVYGGFFAGLLALAARGLPLKAFAAPVLAVMVLDYAENLQLAALLAGFPDLTVAQINAASATTIAKFWAIRFALYWLLGLVLWRIIVALRNRVA